MHADILAKLRTRTNFYKPEIIEALATLHSFQPQSGESHFDDLSLSELEVGMLIVEPIRDDTGDIIVSRDTYITRSILIKMLSMGSHGNVIIEPIKVASKSRT